MCPLFAVATAASQNDPALASCPASVPDQCGWPAQPLFSGRPRSRPSSGPVTCPIPECFETDRVRGLRERLLTAADCRPVIGHSGPA